MATELNETTKISLNPAQLWSIVAALVAGTVYATVFMVSIKSDIATIQRSNQELTGALKKSTTRHMTLADWDMVIWLLQQENPKNNLKFPTAAVLRAARSDE